MTGASMQERQVQIALTAFGLICGAMMVVEILFFGGPALTPASNPAETRSSSSEGEQEQPKMPVENYDAITSRPLFMEDRHPYRPSAVGTVPSTASGAAPGSGSNLALSAVVITPGHQLALIQAGPSTPLQILRPDEGIAGWILKEIRPYAVVLEQGGQQLTLELEIRPGPKNSQPGTVPKP